MKKILFIACLFFTTKAHAYTVYDYSSGTFVNISSSVITASTVTANSLTVVTATITNLTTTNLFAPVNGSSACAGCYGQLISTYVINIPAAPTLVFKHIATMTVTAGDWDLAAGLLVDSNSSTTLGSAILCISRLPESSSADCLYGYNANQIAVAAGASIYPLAIPRYVSNGVGINTFYLKAQCMYSNGLPLFSGSMNARRQ